MNRTIFALGGESGMHGHGLEHRDPLSSCPRRNPKHRARIPFLRALAHDGCHRGWALPSHSRTITERSPPLAASRQGFVPAAARRCSGFHTGAPQRESPLAWNIGSTPPSVPSLRMPGECSLVFASPYAPRVRRWETIPDKLADHTSRYSQVFRPRIRYACTVEAWKHRNSRLSIQYLR